MKRIVAAVLLPLYLSVWGLQKSKAEWSDYYLSPAPPAVVMAVASGFAKQLAAFTLFVKVAIFAGGPLSGVDKMSYADSMAQNFDVMTELYPEFIDPYHYCQSFLAPISPEHARRTNIILQRGVTTHPDTLYLQFFQGFNYFYYMHHPVKSAEVFYELSKKPNAPPWFAHLAGNLMARGGNLLAGRAMLQTMLETEQDKHMKERYRRSIENFDKAIKVQAGLDLYKKDHGKDAASLQELIPRYIDSLPMLKNGFKLVWESPLLRLEHN